MEKIHVPVILCVGGCRLICFGSKCLLCSGLSGLVQGFPGIRAVSRKKEAPDGFVILFLFHAGPALDQAGCLDLFFRFLGVPGHGVCRDRAFVEAAFQQTVTLEKPDVFRLLFLPGFQVRLMGLFIQTGFQQGFRLAHPGQTDLLLGIFRVSQMVKGIHGGIETCFRKVALCQHLIGLVGSLRRVGCGKGHAGLVPFLHGQVRFPGKPAAVGHVRSVCMTQHLKGALIGFCFHGLFPGQGDAVFGLLIPAVLEIGFRGFRVFSFCQKSIAHPVEGFPYPLSAVQIRACQQELLPGLGPGLFPFQGFRPGVVARLDPCPGFLRGIGGFVGLDGPGIVSFLQETVALFKPGALHTFRRVQVIPAKFKELAGFIPVAFFQQRHGPAVLGLLNQFFALFALPGLFKPCSGFFPGTIFKAALCHLPKGIQQFLSGVHIAAQAGKENAGFIRFPVLCQLHGQAVGAFLCPLPAVPEVIQIRKGVCGFPVVSVHQQGHGGVVGTVKSRGFASVVLHVAVRVVCGSQVPFGHGVICQLLPACLLKFRLGVAFQVRNLRGKLQGPLRFSVFKGLTGHIQDAEARFATAHAGQEQADVQGIFFPATLQGGIGKRKHPRNGFPFGGALLSKNVFKQQICLFCVPVFQSLGSHVQVPLQGLARQGGEAAACVHKAGYAGIQFPGTLQVPVFLKAQGLNVGYIAGCVLEILKLGKGSTGSVQIPRIQGLSRLKVAYEFGGVIGFPGFFKHLQCPLPISKEQHAQALCVPVLLNPGLHALCPDGAVQETAKVRIGCTGLFKTVCVFQCPGIQIAYVGAAVQIVPQGFVGFPGGPEPALAHQYGGGQIGFFVHAAADTVKPVPAVQETRDGSIQNPGFFQVPVPLGDAGPDIGQIFVRVSAISVSGKLFQCFQGCIQVVFRQSLHRFRPLCFHIRIPARFRQGGGVPVQAELQETFPGFEVFPGLHVFAGGKVGKVRGHIHLPGKGGQDIPGSRIVLVPDLCKGLLQLGAAVLKAAVLCPCLSIHKAGIETFIGLRGPVKVPAELHLAGSDVCKVRSRVKIVPCGGKAGGGFLKPAAFKGFPGLGVQGSFSLFCRLYNALGTVFKIPKPCPQGYGFAVFFLFFQRIRFKVAEVEGSIPVGAYLLKQAPGRAVAEGPEGSDAILIVLLLKLYLGVGGIQRAVQIVPETCKHSLGLFIGALGIQALAVHIGQHLSGFFLGMGDQDGSSSQVVFILQGVPGGVQVLVQLLFKTDFLSVFRSRQVRNPLKEPGSQGEFSFALKAGSGKEGQIVGGTLVSGYAGKKFPGLCPVFVREGNPGLIVYTGNAGRFRLFRPVSAVQEESAQLLIYFPGFLHLSRILKRTGPGVAHVILAVPVVPQGGKQL